MDALKFKILFFGIVSILLYFLFFYFEKTVMNYYVLGSWYAVLPISTAFLFSIVYGSFANYVIEFFRIKKKK